MNHLASELVYSIVNMYVCNCYKWHIYNVMSLIIFLIGNLMLLLMNANQKQPYIYSQDDFDETPCLESF